MILPLLTSDERRDRNRATLTDRVVLITGGSKGLGLLLAREFGRHGARVAICGRDPAALAWASRQLSDWGISVKAYECDVARRDELVGLLHDTERDVGPIDVLVNNAGVILAAPLDNLTEDDFRQAIDTMLWAPVTASLQVYPGMRTRGWGRIVNITSIGGKISGPHMLPYSTAKFGAVGFSEGLRQELAGSGIAVVTVVPGFTRTGSFVNALFGGQARREFRWFLLGSSLPLISIDAEKAASRIVRATVDGESELTLSLPANAAARLHGMTPGLFTQAGSAIRRWLLPAAVPGQQRKRSGGEVNEEIGAGLLRKVSGLGQEAASRFQPPGASHGNEAEPPAAELATTASNRGS